MSETSPHEASKRSSSDTHPSAGEAAWAWSKRHSPILNVARWLSAQLHPQRPADSVLSAADLPEPITQRIRSIVARTRLRPSEREAVCRELISHAHEAQRADETTKDATQIAADLGEPKAAAKLIRRAMQRKRSPFYQAQRILLRVFLGGLATLIVVYLGLTVRFHLGSPNVQTDYLAVMNEPIRAVPPQDRAISVYRETFAAWKLIETELDAEHEALVADLEWDARPEPVLGNLPALDPEHPHYPLARDAIVGFRPELDRVLEASQRKILGYEYTLAATDWNGDSITLSEDSPDNGMLIYVLLPHLGELRTTARLLAADARLAAAAGDAERVTNTLITIANTGRLQADGPTLIGDLVALAIHALALEETAQILATSPGLLDAQQLQSLQAALTASGLACSTTDFLGETYMFEDLLQRTYTDDGHGDGRLTPEGQQLIADLTEDVWTQRGLNAKAALTLSGPISMEALASRGELSAKHAEYLAVARDVLARGAQAVPDLNQADVEMQSLNALEKARLTPLDIMLPALSSAVNRFLEGRVRTDAVVLALAAERYRTIHGTAPDSAEALVPEFIPAVPSDPFAPGETMRLRVEPASGAMTIYVRGSDGDDDGGRAAVDGPGADRDAVRNTSAFWLRYPERIEGAPDADWVLFPPVEPEDDGRPQVGSRRY